MPQVLRVSGRQRRTAQRNQRGREKRFDSKPVCTAIRRRSEAVGEIFEPALLGPISGRWLASVVMRLPCARQPGERGADPHDEAQGVCNYGRARPISAIIPTGSTSGMYGAEAVEQMYKGTKA